MSVHLYALPEYEPPLRPAPLRPDELADLRDLPVPALVPLPVPPMDAPVWDEPGPVRERLRYLVRLILEVLDGRRQLGQLRGVLNRTAYHSLLTRHQQSSSAGWQHRLRTLRTCRPAPGTVELCATVVVLSPSIRHPRTIAIAARVIEHDDTLRCTALRLLYPNPRR